MPTTVFPWSTTAIQKSGKWNLGLYDANSYSPQGYESQIDFAFTGTACSLAGTGAGAPAQLKVSIDGGSFAMLSSGNPYTTTDIPLCTGLSDTLHTATVKSVGAPFAWIDKTNTVSVTGAAPALSTPSGFGPQYVLRDSTFGQYVAASPLVTLDTSSGYDSFKTDLSATDAEIDLPSGSCDTLKIWCIRAGQKYRLRVDGVFQPAVLDTLNDQTYGWLTLATGLPTTGTHTYSIHLVRTPTNLWIYSVMTVGGAGLTGTTPAVAKECWAFFGDSITQAYVGTGFDSSFGYASTLCLKHGVWCVNRGVGGATVWAPPGGNIYSGETRTADVTDLHAIVGGVATAVAATKLVILYGVNDYMQVVGAETIPQFQAATASMLNQITAALPDTEIYYLGLLDYNANDLTLWRIAAATAATVTASPPVTYYPTQGLVDAVQAHGESYDGLHPATQGYVGKMVPYLESIMLTPTVVSGGGIFANAMNGGFQ